MRAQRIKTGFHRLGLSLAGVSLLAFLAVALRPPSPQSFEAILQGRAQESGEGWMLGLLAATLLVYPAARAFGWIIAGFVGDETKISN